MNDIKAELHERLNAASSRLNSCKESLFERFKFEVSCCKELAKDVGGALIRTCKNLIRK